MNLAFPIFFLVILGYGLWVHRQNAKHIRRLVAENEAKKQAIILRLSEPVKGKSASSLEKLEAAIAKRDKP